MLPAAELTGYRSIEIMSISSQPRWTGFPLRYNKLRGLDPKKMSVSVRVGLWLNKKYKQIAGLLASGKSRPIGFSFDCI
jgi:hypothetical protein